MSTTTMTKAKAPEILYARLLSDFEKEEGLVIKSPDYGLVSAKCPDGSTRNETYGMVMTSGRYDYLVVRNSAGWIARRLPKGSETFWRGSTVDRKVKLK